MSKIHETFANLLEVIKIVPKHFGLKKSLGVKGLTPKGPLSLRGTNGISGRYLWADFLS